MSASKELGKKAVDYLQFSPNPDKEQAYKWLTEATRGTANDPDGAILHYFLQTSMEKVKADDNHTDQFFQDYIDASKYADDAIAAETNEKKKAVLQTIKDNLVAMFVQSGVADCESLQNIFCKNVVVSVESRAEIGKIAFAVAGSEQFFTQTLVSLQYGYVGSFIRAFYCAKHSRRSSAYDYYFL